MGFFSWMGRHPPRTGGLLLMLALVTAALYWPTIHQDFIVIDDDEYVSENPWVNEGMSWEAARWAFTSFYAANWHPLTWISHQADWSVYGAFAGGHHLTNLLLHTLNTLLLFLLLRKLTANTSGSWVVAAAFAWHPLHTESVAWIAERKDLLSTLCLIGTIWAYAGYAGVRRRETTSGGVEGRTRAWGYYSGALLIYAAGLMCKPMLVTLPCLLLLLDYWPLQRGADPLTNQAAGAWGKLLADKLPFLALAAGACLLTVAAQKAGGAIKTTGEVPLALRAFNALSAYGAYLRQTIWPNPLCVFYPLPNHLPVAAGLTCALLLAASIWLALRRRRDHPWLITGWLWFLGSLVPVIGLVQVGRQAHADRYMYIPSIGLLVAAVWAGQHLMRRWPQCKPMAIGLSATGLTACVALTHQQLKHWDNSVALMTYALAHTPNNATSQNTMGAALAKAGRGQEAMAHYRESLRLEPKGFLARLNLGVELANAGQLEDAEQQFARALEQSPHSEVLLNNLGAARARQGNYAEALAQFREAIRWHPTHPKAYYHAAMALQALGEAGEAVTNYAAVLRLDPRSPVTLDRLAGLFARCPIAPYHQPDMAVRLAKQATAMTHDEIANYLNTLATAYAAAGQYTNAITASQNAIRIAQEHVMPELSSKLQNDLSAYQTGRNPESDWKQAR